LGEGLEREREVKNMLFHVGGCIYNLQDLLSKLVSLSRLFPLGGIVLSELVLLSELSKDVILQIPTIKT